MPKNPLAGQWLGRGLNHRDPKKQLAAIGRVNLHIELDKMTRPQAGPIAAKLSRNLLSSDPRVALSSAEAIGEIIHHDVLSKTQVTKGMVKAISNGIFLAELDIHNHEKKPNVHDLLPMLAHKKLLSEGLSRLAVAEILAKMESGGARGLDSGEIGERAIINLHANGAMAKEHVVDVISKIAPKITEHASNPEAQDPYMGMLRVFTDNSPRRMLRGKIPDEIITWAIRAYEEGKDEGNKALRAQGVRALNLIRALSDMDHLTPEQGKRIFGF